MPGETREKIVDAPPKDDEKKKTGGRQAETASRAPLRHPKGAATGDHENGKNGTDFPLQCRR